MARQDEIVLGIDLGTSNSAAAVLIGGRPIMIPPAEGPTDEGDVFPSYVAFDSEGNLSTVGLPAKERFINVGGELVVRHIKRIIGRPYNTILSDIQSDKRFIQEFKGRIKQGSHGKIGIRIGKSKYTPQEITTFLLKKIMTDAKVFAQEKIGKGIDHAMISIPAGFEDGQRKATKEAGETVFGKGKVGLIEEPLAAAIATGIKREQAIMVLDMGAGTTDIVIGNIVMIPGGPLFLVTTQSCDDQLGGWDMDYKILEQLFEEDNGKPTLEDLYLCADKRERGRLMAAIEKAKIATSTIGQGIVSTALRVNMGGKEISRIVNYTLQERELAEIVGSVTERCRKLIEQTLIKVADKLKCREEEVIEEIDRIILVGGPTRMQCIRNMVQEVFEHNQQVWEEFDQYNDITETFHVECVAKGAAMGGHVVPIVPYSVGIYRWINGYRRIIEKGIPYEEKCVRSISFAVKPPDEEFLFLSEKGEETGRSGDFPLRIYQVSIPQPGQMKVIVEWSMDGCEVICHVPGVGKVQWPSLKDQSNMNIYLQDFMHNILTFVRNIGSQIERIKLEYPDLAQVMEINEEELKICESIDVKQASSIDDEEVRKVMKKGGSSIEQLLEQRGVPQQVQELLSQFIQIVEPGAAPTWELIKLSLDELIRKANSYPDASQICKQLQKEMAEFDQLIKEGREINPDVIKEGAKMRNLAIVLGDTLCDREVMTREEWEEKKVSMSLWYRGLWRQLREF